MDAPFRIADGRLQARLLACIDIEDKIPRALDALGSVAGRRTLLLETVPGSFRARQIEVLGARVTTWPTAGGAGAGPFDVAIAWWTGFADGGSGVTAGLAAAERALAPGGRLLVVQDYGRDDVAALLDDPIREARLQAWSERGGPVLRAGFRVRTLHCWWTFASREDATDLLAHAFPATGAAVAATLRRPRLAYKVAIYHRVIGDRRAAA